MSPSRDLFARDTQITPSKYQQLFTNTVTSEFAQFFLKCQISTALEIVLEPLMEQHSFTIVKKPQTATIFWQCIVNSFVTTY